MDKQHRYNDSLKLAQANTLFWFERLMSRCPHREDTDCAHPKLDFSRMTCDISNCPLLQEPPLD